MTTIRISGMKCQHCVAVTRKTLEDLGLTQVQVDLIKGEVSFEGKVDMEAVRNAIAAQGFTVVD
jgi:copper chaperone